MSKSQEVQVFGGVVGHLPATELTPAHQPGEGMSLTEAREAAYDANPFELRRDPNYVMRTYLGSDQGTLGAHAEVPGRFATIIFPTGHSRTGQTIRQAEVAVNDLDACNGNVLWQAGAQAYEDEGQRERFAFSDTTGAHAFYRHSPDTEQMELLGYTSDETPHGLAILYTWDSQGRFLVKYGLPGEWIAAQAHRILHSNTPFFNQTRSPRYVNGELDYDSVGDINFKLLIRMMQSAHKLRAGQHLSDQEMELLRLGRAHSGQVSNPLIRTALLFGHKLPHTDKAIQNASKHPLFKKYLLEGYARAAVMANLRRKLYGDWRIGAVLENLDMADKDNGLRKAISRLNQVDDSDEGAETWDKVHGSLYVHQYKPLPGEPPLMIQTILNTPEGKQVAKGSCHVPAYWQLPYGDYAHLDHMIERFKPGNILPDLAATPGMAADIIIQLGHGNMEYISAVDLGQAPGRVAKAIAWGGVSPYAEYDPDPDTLHHTYEDALSASGPYQRIGHDTPAAHLALSRQPLALSSFDGRRHDLHGTVLDGQVLAVYEGTEPGSNKHTYGWWTGHVAVQRDQSRRSLFSRSRSEATERLRPQIPRRFYGKTPVAAFMVDPRSGLPVSIPPDRIPGYEGSLDSRVRIVYAGPLHDELNVGGR